MKNYKSKYPVKKSIEPEVITGLKEQLKGFDINWIQLLADKMYPLTDETREGDPQNTKGKRKVYGITTGMTSNNSARVLFILKGNELLKEYQERQDEATSIITELELSPQNQ